MFSFHCWPCEHVNRKKRKKSGTFRIVIKLKIFLVLFFIIFEIIKKRLASAIEVSEQQNVFFFENLNKWKDVELSEKKEITRFILRKQQQEQQQQEQQQQQQEQEQEQQHQQQNCNNILIMCEHIYENNIYVSNIYKRYYMNYSKTRIRSGRYLSEEIVQKIKDIKILEDNENQTQKGQIPIASNEVAQGLTFFCFIFLSATMLQFILSKIHKLNIPVSVIWFLYGMLTYVVAKNFNFFGNNPLYISVINARNIDSSVLYFILLPILLYEATQDINYYAFKNFIYGGIGLAVVGVALQVGILGFLFYYSFMYKQEQSPLPSSFLLASVLSSTDPVAVLSILSVVDAPSKISSMFHVESLINDGSSVLLFQFFYYLTIGYKANATEYTILFVKLLFLSPIFGIAMAMLMFSWMNLYKKYYYNQCLATITMCYVCYFISEYYFNLSGPLAIVCYGLFINAYGHIALDEVAQQKHKEIIELLALMGNSGVFIISGIVSFGMMENVFKENLNFFWYILLTYFYLLLARSLMIFIFTPFLAKIDYKVNWKEIMLLIWGGLRGGIVLVLGLRIEAAKDISDNLTKELAYYISGSVLLILTLQGLTFECLYRLLNTYPPNPFRIVYLEKVLKMIDYNYNIRKRTLQNHWLFKDTNILQFSNKIVPELYWRKMNKIGNFDLNLPDIYSCLHNINGCDISKWDNMYNPEKGDDDFDNFSFSNIRDIDTDSKTKKNILYKNDSIGKNRKKYKGMLSWNKNRRHSSGHYKMNYFKDKRFRCNNNQLSTNKNMIYYIEEHRSEEMHFNREDMFNKYETTKKKCVSAIHVHDDNNKDTEEKGISMKKIQKKKGTTLKNDNVIINLFSQNNASRNSSDFYESSEKKGESGKTKETKKWKGKDMNNVGSITKNNIEENSQYKLNVFDYNSVSSNEYKSLKNHNSYMFVVKTNDTEQFPMVSNIVNINVASETFDPKYNLRLIEHATDIPKTLSDDQLFAREERHENDKEGDYKLDKLSNEGSLLLSKKNKFLISSDKKKKMKGKQKEVKKYFSYFSDQGHNAEEDKTTKKKILNHANESITSSVAANMEDFFNVHKHFRKEKKQGGSNIEDAEKKKKKKGIQPLMNMGDIEYKSDVENSIAAEENNGETVIGDDGCRENGRRVISLNAYENQYNTRKKEKEDIYIENRMNNVEIGGEKEKINPCDDMKFSENNVNMLLMNDDIIIRVNQKKHVEEQRETERKINNHGNNENYITNEDQKKERIKEKNNSDIKKKYASNNISGESTSSKPTKNKSSLFSNGSNGIAVGKKQNEESLKKEMQKGKKLKKWEKFSCQIFGNVFNLKRGNKSKGSFEHKMRESVKNQKLNKKLKYKIEKNAKNVKEQKLEQGKVHYEREKSYSLNRDLNTLEIENMYNIPNTPMKIQGVKIKRNNTVDLITQRCDTDQTIVFEQIADIYEKKYESPFFNFMRKREKKKKKKKKKKSELSKAESYESYIHIPNISKEMDDMFYLTLKKKKIVRKEREGELYIMIFNTCRESYKKLYVNGFISGECLLTLNAILDLSADFALKKVRMNPIKAWADALEKGKIKSHIKAKRKGRKGKINSRRYLDHSNGFEFEFYTLLSKLKINKKKNICFVPLALNIFFVYEHCINDLQIVLSYVDVHQCTLDKGGITMKLLLGEKLLRSYYRNIQLAKNLIPYIVNKYKDVVKYCLIKIGTDMLLHLKKTIVNEQAASGLLLSQDNEKLNGIFEEQQVKVNRYRPYLHYIFKRNTCENSDKGKRRNVIEWIKKWSS